MRSPPGSPPARSSSRGSHERRSARVLVHLMAIRVAWLLAGLAWAARTVMEFAHPDYFDPVTLLDWSAVGVYSAAWLLSALAVALLARSICTTSVRAIAAVVAAGAIVAGLANAAEDALGASWGGTPYVVGFMVGWISLIPLAAVVWRSHSWRLALLPLALFASIALFNSGGGLLILGVATTYWLMPRWFAARIAAGEILVPRKP